MRKRTNDEWLVELLGRDKDLAITDLRNNLVKGLRYALVDHIQSDLDAHVEDFAQDAITKVLDNLHTFRGESQFITWAQKIAIRVAFSELRRKRWKDISLEDILTRDDDGDYTPTYMSDPAPPPESHTTQIMLMNTVIELINHDLTERQRQAMMAVIVGGMPLEEVARRMGTNRNALYKLIHDARMRLKNKLEEKGLSPNDILAAFENG